MKTCNNVECNNGSWPCVPRQRPSNPPGFSFAAAGEQDALGIRHLIGCQTAAAHSKRQSASSLQSSSHLFSSLFISRKLVVNNERASSVTVKVTPAKTDFPATDPPTQSSDSAGAICSAPPPPPLQSLKRQPRKVVWKYEMMESCFRCEGGT